MSGPTPTNEPHPATELSRRYDALLRVLEQGVIVQDTDLLVVEANAPAEILFGAPEGMLVHRVDPVVGAVDEDYRSIPAVHTPAAVALRTGLPVYGRIIGIPPVDGASHRWYSVNAVPLFSGAVEEGAADSAGNGPAVDAVVSSFTDVTERKALEMELTHLALHDGLTGVANRTLLVDRIGHAMARFARRVADPNVGVSMLYVDIDSFKEINDHFGNRVGDEILRILAQRLKSAVREEDTVARIGGDEFAVLCDEMNRTDLARFCVRVSQAFSQPVICRVGDEWRSVAIGCTAGVAMARSGEDADRFLQRVDKMLKEQCAESAADRGTAVRTPRMPGGVTPGNAPGPTPSPSSDSDSQMPGGRVVRPARGTRADGGDGTRWRPGTH